MRRLLPRNGVVRHVVRDLDRLGNRAAADERVLRVVEELVLLEEVEDAVRDQLHARFPEWLEERYRPEPSAGLREGGDDAQAQHVGGLPLKDGVNDRREVQQDLVRGVDEVLPRRAKGAAGLARW